MPQGEYPSAISSSLVLLELSLFCSAIDAAPEQSGLWKRFELVLSTYPVAFSGSEGVVSSFSGGVVPS